MNSHELTPEQIKEIERRVLWLSARIVDYANHDRPNDDGIKVGGHQSSSASVVSIMTALWLNYLTPQDRVSVKPHASPVMHALWYLTGQLDCDYLTKLRSFKGLQAYPSRTKDPDRVDFSTGSVGLGAAAPLFAAATRRYVDSHFGPRPTSRFISLMGDAELDEGNIWEAIADPSTRGLGNVMWIVDFNRQSLDRVVPGVRISEWRGLFESSGWHVTELKYGQRAMTAFAQPGGQLLRHLIDDMSNEQYQSLFMLHGDEFKQRLLSNANADSVRFVESMGADDLRDVVLDLGGHDHQALLDSFKRCDAVVDRPSVLFAYTIKGWGLPFAGNPRNHSALMSTEQVNTLREQIGLTVENEWSRFDPDSPIGAALSSRGAELAAAPAVEDQDSAVVCSEETGVSTSNAISTQDAFGRILVSLSRNEELARSLVTVAPDVATSTNLAGFINRTGVFTPVEVKSWQEDSLVKWTEGPRGQHIELGISEMNLFLMLGQLGLSAELSDRKLVPIGTVYDPFVCRGLDALIYSVYSGSRFIFAGTPSGVTLAPEGGAHQSTITPSIGTELPGLCLMEPTYAKALDWMLCEAVSRVAQVTEDDSGEQAFYFRLTTRPIEQAAFAQAEERYGSSSLRRMVLAGAYRLVDGRREGVVDGFDAPEVTLAACGAVMREVLEAAEELTAEGVNTHVVDITSPSRLYRDWQSQIRLAIRGARPIGRSGVLRSAFPSGVPIVSVHDAASHSLAWLGSALGVPGVSLGVDAFGESGSIPALYEKNDLSAGAIVNAALGSLDLQRY